MTERNFTSIRVSKQERDVKTGSFRKITQGEFIDRVQKIHPEIDFTKSVYINAKTKITATCKDHGDFKKDLRGLYKGQGCPTCGREQSRLCQMKTQEDFVRQAAKVHGGRYDYTHTVYKGAFKDIVIECSEHGTYKQRASTHLEGFGCSKCSEENKGWSRQAFVRLCNKNASGVATLYVLRCEKGTEKFYKVGITSRTVADRYSWGMPYEYKLLYEVRNTAAFIYDLERKLKKRLKAYNHKPSIDFEGRTECFSTLDGIEKELTKLQSDKQLQLIA